MPISNVQDYPIILFGSRIKLQKCVKISTPLLNSVTQIGDNGVVILGNGVLILIYKVAIWKIHHIVNTKSFTKELYVTPKSKNVSYASMQYLFYTIVTEWECPVTEWR